jgi:hypothetical protein
MTLLLIFMQFVTVLDIRDIGQRLGALSTYDTDHACGGCLFARLLQADEL